MGQATGLIGVALLLGLACLFSTDRRRINPRIVITGVLAQFILAYLFLKFDPVVNLFDGFALVVTKVISFADSGTEFIFGKASDATGPWGFIFAVKVLPVIIFFASLMSVLYHLGIMQRIVAAVAWMLRKGLGVTGVEALSAAANIFVGQTEAPLTVRPYIAGMTRSQLMAIMTGGFATIAGSVMAAYIGILGDAYGTLIGDAANGRLLFAKHLITASVMSAPAGLVMAKIMLPESESPPAEDLRSLTTGRGDTTNIMDAAAVGATDGLKLALNVAAMLIAFVALLAMINYPLAELSRQPHIASWRAQHGLPEFSLENILGLLFTPIAWAMGVAGSDCRAFGSLLGQQIIATEFVAYLDLAAQIKAQTLQPRSAQIATYALCGFANLPSIAIQIGGLSAMAPQRRADLAAIGPRAMVAGALACWMTGAVASLFIA